jgi:hypothetical protein
MLINLTESLYGSEVIAVFSVAMLLYYPEKVLDIRTSMATA